MKLTPNLIYEAALDDQLFAELPAIVATAMGARSCVLHWRDQSGAAEISTHSGYFSDANMADYAENFTRHDLWTDAGMGQELVNRGWRTTDLVPSADYERSVFYNEWIRAMGDDTYYCCGSVMRTSHGFGIIGLHRGRTQDDFSDEVLGELNEQVDHLRRMFTIRGKISQLTERNDLLGAIFASGRQAAFVVSSAGRIIQANDAGNNLLRSGQFLCSRSGRLRPAVDPGQEAFDVALGTATDRAGGRASSCLLRSADGAFVIASLMPLLLARAESAALVTVDAAPDRQDFESIGQHIQHAFALSRSEAEIALLLADGATINEISERRRSSVGTVRTQVKHILSKMDARRQGDIVRVISVLRRGLPARANANG